MGLNLKSITEHSFPVITAAPYYEKLKSAPDYQKAKFEAIESAAKTVVRQVANKKFTAKLKDIFDRSDLTDAIVVAPYKADSKNKLARVFATKVAKTFGFDIDTHIVQLPTVKKMQNCSKIERLLNTVSFAGEVDTTKPYIIVDDTVSSGRTVKALKDYIENAGGTVKFGVSLATIDGEDIDLSISQSAVQNLRANIAQSLQSGEKNVRKLFEKAGIDFNSFTSVQADYFSNGTGKGELVRLAKQIAGGNTPNFGPT